ncbi:MAG: M28 family peptidase, partial [bacterium]|nr:M28 family peptidase [bacterium]
SSVGGNISGKVVFVGCGVSAPQLGWDDYEGVDVEGKFVVHIDGDLPDEHPINKPENRMYLYRSYRAPRSKGALGTITIHDERREKTYREKELDFDNPESGRVIWDEEEYKRQLQDVSQTATERPYLNITVRHSVGAELLGVSESELINMFNMIKNGQQIPSRESDKTVEVNVGVNKRRGHTRNVVAYLEGSDPKLKDEYIVIGSHYDHVGARRGEINNGADDDGSGTVAMLEIAQALSVERPKRSVIMVWHTGEEKGLWGAHWFVENSPVPLKNISAMLQMDMISRNAPDSIYVIGSHFLSSELDEISDKTAKKQGLINQSDFYNDPNKRRNFHRNSDHYAYHEAGIPGIFYFCGVHEDLHSPTDTIDRCNFDKMYRVTRLVYATCISLGNTKNILKLDRNPNITSRGKHNIGPRRER